MSDNAQALRDLLGDIGAQDFPALAVPPGPHSYRVVAVRADGRCDLAAVKKGPPPTIPNVDHWSASGASSKPVVGSLVVIAFLDGDSAQPMICSYQPLRVDGGVPTESTLDAADLLYIGPSAAHVHIAGEAPAAKAAARIGDTVSLGYLVGVAGSGPGALPVFFTLSTTDPDPIPSQLLTGTITSGSPKVIIG